MDDQAIGVNSYSQGLRSVAAIADSLAKLYLTANSKKTKILSLREAAIHFHLDANAAIDLLEKKIASRAASRKGLVRELGRVWRAAQKNRDKGEWEKIQKRVYRLAGSIKAKTLRKKAVRDIIKSPMLAEHVADYMRCSGSAVAYLKFVKAVLEHKEQIYEDVDLLLTESLLRLQLRGNRARSILNMAVKALDDVRSMKRHFVFAAPACLLVVRFGDNRGKSRLRRYFEERLTPKPSQLVRASAIAYATYGKNEFATVRRAAAVLLTNPLALMVRMVRRLQKLDHVPVRFKSRLSIRRDPVTGRHYIDMRTLVALRLLALNKRKSVRVWLSDWIRQANRKKISSFDKKLLKGLTT